MRHRKFLLLTFFFFNISNLFSQNNNGIIEGRVVNLINNEPVPFANIILEGTTIGSTSDIEGNFSFYGLKPGYVRLLVSSIGFETYASEDIMVTNAKKHYIEVRLNETVKQLDEIKVKASPFRKPAESPVSMRSIGIKDIEKNPGGNRDISRVIQSLPGVASTPTYRNDVIVRGGGASENRFYIDGVEIPNLNHFATQGASGGPVGIINVDFVREVDFYSGAFPANRGNALSSVLEFKQVDGNLEKMKFRGAFGASDLALTMDGPLGKNTGMILSARRSYLQFLFKSLGLPFLPIYNDFQFKIRHRIDEKNEIMLIGLGAVDQFELNTGANETEEQRYILNYLPVNEQWNYTTGAVYKHYRGQSYDTWVISRNHLNNISWKYRNNIETDSLKTLDYASNEIENKIRFERTTRFDNGAKLVLGAGSEIAEYDNNTFSKVYIAGNPFEINYKTNLSIFKYSAFGQYSRPFAGNRLNLSAGLRTDANNYSPVMANPLTQLSPRFSAAWALTEKMFLNFNTGVFYQLPAYTTLGFRDNTQKLVNKENDLQYIRATHWVSGIEYRPDDNSRITLEGFYKIYANYPFSVNDSVSLSNKGADYGVVGDEAVTSDGKGRAYGMELLIRHTDFYGFNFILSYTLVRSEFTDKKGKYIPSAWDNKHIVNITGTRKFRGNWDVGFKWRLVGGAPYTPYDLETSSYISAWNVRNQPYLDYSRFNSLRLKPFHQLDLRVDKQFFFDKWSLMLYTDIQNVYAFKAQQPDNYTHFDKNGVPDIDSQNSAKYVLRKIPQDTRGTVLPTIGIIAEF